MPLASYLLRSLFAVDAPWSNEEWGPGDESALVVHRQPDPDRR
jgi:hypothetical protein